MVTKSAEAYLLAIYRLTESQPWAKSGQIAAAMDVQMSSVSEMLNRLEAGGYVVRHGRTGAKLTRSGQQLAVNRLRKHCLLTTFLVTMAGYEIDEVYEEAGSLEHVVSDRLANSLDKLLGYPATDLFGHPIPNADSSVAVIHFTPLSEVAVGKTVVICSVDGVDGKDKQTIYYLRVWGLVPGALVQVIEVSPLQGPITVAVAGNERPISYELAKKIGVELNA